MALGTREMHQVERSTRLQHAAYLAQRVWPVVSLNVMEHQRRKHAIEIRIRVWQLLGESLIEMGGKSRTRRLLPGSGKRLRVGIKSPSFDARIKPFEDRQQSARPAAGPTPGPSA